MNMNKTKAESRIRELGGVAKSCPYCHDQRLENRKVVPICSHCDSTGLVSLIDYERYFAEKYGHPIDLSACRIPERLKELQSIPESDCPF